MTTAFRQTWSGHLSGPGIDASTWQHPSGATHYHLAAPNTENAFLVAFRTLPESSDGVAHILEHLVLCGSDRYPVRDPFFLMMRRSLATFMNAFTGCDYTAFPFASANDTDYRNLLDVYLDAVFFPTLNPLDFAQEGHRLEFVSPEDGSSPLVRQGVVLNEMRGDMASVMTRLQQYLQTRLYPGTTYAHNSGGDPGTIPDLTLEGLLAFHRQFYCPANAIFMSFGDRDPADIQASIQSTVFDRLPEDRLGGACARVLPVSRYPAPVRFKDRYPASDAGAGTRDPTHVVIGWLLGDVRDVGTLMRSHLLSDLLMDTSASPLRHALEQLPGVVAVSPISGLDDQAREANFACGVEVTDPAMADEIERCVLATLARIAQAGVDPSEVTSLLDQFELLQREIGGDGMPYGLQLLFAGLNAAVHDPDNPAAPFRMMDLSEEIETLRHEAARPSFVSELVTQLLIDNPHRVTLTFEPYSKIASDTEAREQRQLASLAASLTDKARDELVLAAEQLSVRQAEPDDVERLPRVHVTDIPREASYPSCHQLGNLSHFDVATNGIAYHQLAFSLADWSPAELSWLPVYGQLVTEVGSAGDGYLATQRRQQQFTAGFSAYSTIRSNPDDCDSLYPWFILGTRALGRYVDPMVSLMCDTALAADFDEPDRLRDLLLQLRSRRERSLQTSGQAIAATLSGATLRPGSGLLEQLSGLSGINRLRRLLEGVDDTRINEIAVAMGQVRRRLSETIPHVLWIGELAEGTKQALVDHWQGAAVRNTLRADVRPLSKRDRAILVDGDVSDCVALWPAVAESHEDAAALTVLGGVLRHRFLHAAVREQGGAYGADAAYDPAQGLFRCSSYRDPRISGSFADFDEALPVIRSQPVSRDEVEAVILGVMGSNDAPGSPKGEARFAFHQWLNGRDADRRRLHRGRLLGVTPDDVARVAETYLAVAPVRAVVAGRERRHDVPDSFQIIEGKETTWDSWSA